MYTSRLTTILSTPANWAVAIFLNSEQRIIQILAVHVVWLIVTNETSTWNSKVIMQETSSPPYIPKSPPNHVVLTTKFGEQSKHTA